MIGRMLGAALLRTETYEEVEKDSGATIQALLVVIIFTLANVVGEVLGRGEDADVIRALTVGICQGLASWAVWALFTWKIGTTILKQRILRPTGNNWRAARDSHIHPGF